MNLVEAVRRANQPGVPENSVRLRVACLGTVLVAIAACASLQEITWTTAAGAMVLVSAGTAFSHATRARPPGWVKVLVAVGAIGACVWFFHEVSSPTAGITSVINPLTVLLVTVLVVHSFHVPSRRDLVFTLAASAGLMAVGGSAGHRSPLRPLRRGLGLLRPLGPDGNVGLGQRRGPHLHGGSGAGAGSDVGGGGGRLPRSACTGGLVARLLHRPGRCRRLGGRPRCPGRRLGRRRPTVPRRQSRQPDPRRRLSRLCGQPEHGAARELGQHTGDAGPGPAPLVLGRGDLRHLAGPELDGVAARAATPVARELAVHPSHPAGRRAVRAKRPPDVLHLERDGEPRVPRRERERGVVSRRQALRRRRRHHRVAARPGHRVRLHRRFAGEHRHARAAPERRRPVLVLPVHAAAGGAVAAPVPSCAGVGPVDHRARHQHLRQGAVPHPLDRRPHPLLGEHPAAAPRRRHGRRVSLRQPGRILRADLDLTGRDAALAGHPRPGGGGLRARGLQPDHRPLPGPRQRRPCLGAGVVPRLRLAGLRPDGGRAGHPAQPRRGRVARCRLGSRPHPSGSGRHGRRGGRSRRRLRALAARARPATWAERVARSAERAGRRAGRPRRPSETLAEYAVRLDALGAREDATWSRLASSVEASAYGGLDPPPGMQRILVLEAKRAKVQRRRGAGSADAPGRTLEKV